MKRLREMNEAELRYYTLYEQFPDGILIIDTYGKIIEFNEAAHRQLGYSREEFAKLNLSDIDPFERPEETQASIQRVLKEGKAEFEVKHKTKDGDIRNVKVITQVIDLSGCTVFHTIWRDITEQKRAEDEMLESRERLALISGASFEGIGISENGRIIDANPQLARMLGYEPQDLIGMEVSRFVAPESRELVARKIQEDFSDAYEHKALKKDGTEIFLEARGQKGLYKGRNVRITAIRDITDRKEAEKALAGREERYRILFHQSPIALWEEDMSEVKAIIDNLKGSGVTDFGEYFDVNPHVVAECAAKVRIIDVNNATLAMYKATSKDEFFGGLPSIFTDESYIVFKENLVKLAEQRELEEAEAVNKSLDGHEMQILIRWDIPSEASDTLSRVIVSTVDVSGLKRLEKRLKQALNEKDVLMREIHHRVKNNMQVITSLLRLQAEHVRDENTIEQFFECQNRIRSMALVHEKLYLSENLANIDFRNYVEALTNGLRSSFGKLSYNVKFAIDMDEITLNTDTTIYCGLVINELVSNSIRHAFPGDGEDEIRITARKNNNDDIELTVADNGIGIPEGLDFRNPGSLGLDLVVLIAESQLGGEIALKRARGTEFKVMFKELRYSNRM